MNDPERPANPPDPGATEPALPAHEPEPGGADEPALSASKPARPADEPALAATDPEHRNGEPEQRNSEPAHPADEPALSATDPERRNAEPEHRNSEPAHPAAEPTLSATDPALAATDPERRTGEPARPAHEAELHLAGLRADEAALSLSDEPPRHNVIVDGAIALFLLLALASPVALVVAGAAGAMVGAFSRPAGLVVAFITAIAAVLLSAVRLYRWVRSQGRERAVRIIAVLTLFILPPWGLVYNHFVVEPECTVGSCSDKYFRPFAEPEIFGLLALHALTVIAYQVSRRRPEALRPAGEALVHATLLAGILVHAVVAVHLAPWTARAFVLPPVLLPLFAPAVTVCLYTGELLRRLRRRGREAAEAIEPPPAPTAYRHAPPEPPPAPLRVHRGSLLRALALTPALLGVHAVLHALWLGRADGALRVLTRTCDHVLSLQPVVILPEDCHYLCTVAARGHAWLVRPARLGRRHGIAIVVNRQLAVANAFEDLLHERWPRFGRLARRLYDRLGLPVSRYIRGPWLADLTYLAMKPAEWLFALALLLLDRDSPERRIDRMYR